MVLYNLTKIQNSFHPKTILLSFALISVLASKGQEFDSAWIVSNRLAQYSKDTGTMLTDYVLYDEFSLKRSISEFRGKILYINVWSLSCAPCIENFPYFEQLQKRLKAANIDSLVQVINVCMEPSKNKWKRKLKQHNPSGINLLSTDDPKKLIWNVDYWPRCILVDSVGKIMCYYFSGPDEGNIDYSLFAATKGVKPAESEFMIARQFGYRQKHGSFTDDTEGTAFAKWFSLVEPSWVEYYQWRVERGKARSHKKSK